jgi:predicted transcriptional regulator
MTTPLGVNEDISKRLLTYIEENKYPENMREMAQTILISSKQVRLHAYNFLDQKLISSERFQANYSLGSVTEAIHEIVEIIQLTLVRKDVVVATDMTFIDDFYPSFLYDRRRL